MKNTLFGIIICVTLIIIVSAYLFVRIRKKAPPEPKADFSEILNRKWSEYHGGGREEIDSIKDDLDLKAAVGDWSTPKASSYTDALKEAMTYTPGKRAVYLIDTLDSEVCNGGFNQYFFNKGTVLAKETINSLLLIGQTERAAILEKALKDYSFVRESHATAHAKGSPETLIEAFSQTYEDNPLNHLDSQYYKADSDIWKILASYIRSNPDEFAQ